MRPDQLQRSFEAKRSAARTLQAENAALKAEVMSLADERDGFKAALVQALAEVERLTALRVEMFNAIVEYGAGDDLLYHVLKAIMDAWFAGGAP